MIRICFIACLSCIATLSHALEIGTADYRFVSELLAEGYTPFGTGGSARDLFAMENGTDIYLCFLLDTPDDQSARQSALLSELQGGGDDRSVPNIPVVCVLTQ